MLTCLKSTYIITGILVLSIISTSKATAQKTKIDSLFMKGDTTAVMDSLMKDFESFLDSLSAPKSFFNVSVGIGTGIFSFENQSSVLLTTEKSLMFSSFTTVTVPPGFPRRSRFSNSFLSSLYLRFSYSV